MNLCEVIVDKVDYVIDDFRGMIYEKLLIIILCYI